MVCLMLKAEKFVYSELLGRSIPISSEAWRHECEVAFFLGLPESKREEMLVGSADGRVLGLKQIRGQSFVDMIRREMKMLAKIRGGSAIG